jgi:hypothetical protein
MQSGASYTSSAGASDFHRASLNFYFPPNVSLAGRVWQSRCAEVRIYIRKYPDACLFACATQHTHTNCMSQWHEDVSILPSTIFLRAELAAQTELKTAFAVPLCKDTRVIAVCIFYSRQALPPSSQGEQACVVAANELLATALMRR